MPGGILTSSPAEHPQTAPFSTPVGKLLRKSSSGNLPGKSHLNFQLKWKWFIKHCAPFCASELAGIDSRVPRDFNYHLGMVPFILGGRSSRSCLFACARWQTSSLERHSHCKKEHCDRSGIEGEGPSWPEKMMDCFWYMNCIIKRLFNYWLGVVG